MLGTTHPRAPRLLSALGLGLISAALTVGAVFGGMLVLRPAETGEDWAGMFAFLLALASRNRQLDLLTQNAR